jgi:hypothetical protein
LTDAQEGFWGYIHDLYARFASSAPSGRHALVEVETHDGRTFEPRALQVYGTFLICEVGDKEVEVLAVREADVRRVRIFQASEEDRLAVGFRVGELDVER